jgi:hypothetical protein
LGKIYANRFGVEFGLLNRISVEADYIKKNTDGLLFSVPLALVLVQLPLIKILVKFKVVVIRIYFKHKKNIDS